MRKMQLGMRREVIKNAENAIENAPGTAPESQKAYKKLISQKFSLFSPFTLDIILDYSIFGPVNERRQQKQNADVAQLDRAFGYEPKGSRFESWHPQKRRPTERLVFFFFIFVVLKPVGLKDPVTFCVSVILNIPRSRHPERSEVSSYFSFRNTRLYWMFRGYASQHDAKRFGVRMTQHKTLLDPSGFQPSG